MVAYNNKKYYIDIIETKPDNAISIIETDCEVDFAPPLDYKEPEKPVAPHPTGKAPVAGMHLSDSCLSYCLFGFIIGTVFVGKNASSMNVFMIMIILVFFFVIKTDTFLLAAEDTPAETEPKFNPFSGTGRRLDGKPLKYEPDVPVSSSSGSKDKKPDVPNVNSQSSTTSSSQSNARQSQGKLVFGSNANRSKETGKVICFLATFW